MNTRSVIAGLMLLLAAITADAQRVIQFNDQNTQFISGAVVSGPKTTPVNAGMLKHGVNDLLLYPNRVVYKTNIELPFMMTGTVYLDVIDMTGHVVHNTQDINWTNTITFDMSNFAPGQYTLRVYATTLGVHDLRVEKQ